MSTTAAQQEIHAMPLAAPRVTLDDVGTCELLNNYHEKTVVFLAQIKGDRDTYIGKVAFAAPEETMASVVSEINRQRDLSA